MKNRISLFIALLLVSFASLQSCKSEIIEIQADETIRDYSPVIRRILSGHPDGNIIIRFGEGTYPFYPEEAFSEFLNLSNNDSGQRKVAFLIKKMKNVTIECSNSKFLFHGAIVPFAIKDSEDIKIGGFNIDYDYPWTLEGKVVSNDPVKHTFILEIFPDNKYRIENGRLLFGGYDWEYPMAENIVFDPKTRRPYFNTSLYEHGYWAGEMHAREIKKGFVEFSSVNSKEVPPIGSIWDDKGPMDVNRSYPGIAVLCSKNIDIENVHISKSGAMALIAEFSENITVKGMSTAAEPGSKRMITASADATHFVDCKGHIILEDCIFESMLDDATNIHGIYVNVDTLISNTSFRTSFGHFQQEGVIFGKEGDIIRFIDKKTLRPLGEGRLKRIDRSNRKSYDIETSFNLSGLSAKDVAVENISRGASATIRNCKVRYNRARSLLISTPGDVLIENCTFSSMMAGIRICGDANYWFESGNTRNVIIRNNNFKDIGIGGHQPQAILQIDPVIPNDSRGNDFYFHNNISFEDNYVETFDSQIIYGLSVKKLNISGNKFIDSKTYKTIFPQLSVIDLQYCGKVIIKNNDFSEWKKDATISAYKCEELENDSELPVVDNPNPFFYGS